MQISKYHTCHSRAITFCVITLCVRKVVTFCIEKLLHFALNTLLDFALVLHFGDSYYILRQYYILRNNRATPVNDLWQMTGVG